MTIYNLVEFNNCLSALVSQKVQKQKEINKEFKIKVRTARNRISLLERGIKRNKC